MRSGLSSPGYSLPEIKKSIKTKQKKEGNKPLNLRSYFYQYKLIKTHQVLTLHEDHDLVVCHANRKH